MDAGTDSRLAIVADDLTGALDSAAPLAGVPGGVAVATSVAALARALDSGAGVIAVSTRSREIAAEAAHHRVAEVLTGLPPGLRVIKKIDSRLKGNIAAELAAFGPRRFLVLPAIPEFGRIVRDGRLSGFGVETPIDVRAVLGAAADMALVPDVDSAAAMRAALDAAPRGAILVGARGMTRALAGCPAPAPALPLPRPLRFVVGSTDPITLAQAERLRAACPGMAVITAPAGAVPAGSAPGIAALIQAMPGTAASPDEVAARLAAGAAPLLGGSGTLVLTGGATAEAVLDALGLDLLSLAGEVLPGVPVCRAGGQSIVTKSGGFGDPETLARIAAMSDGG